MLRIVATLATAAFFAAAALEHEEPAAMLAGLTPIAWLAVEACWRLLAPRP